MKKIKLILTLVFVGQLIFFSSCDRNFDEVNSDPNVPAVVPSELLLAGVIRSTADRLQSSFGAGEIGSAWAQHLSKTVYNDHDYYIPRQNSIQALWNVLYASVIKDADVMQDLALEEGNSNMQGVALILKANAFQLLADSFGNVPMSEAVGGDNTGNFTPVYDECSDVYANVIDMYAQASTLLNGSGEINTSQDLIYNGDWSKWKKLANSLAFRAIMRASGNSGYSVGNQLKSLVSAGNLFTSNDDGAVMPYLSATPNANPYFEALVEGGRTGEWCIGEELVNRMVGDPRLPVYAQEVGGNGSGNGYVGKPAGIKNLAGTPWSSNTVSWIGEKFLLPEAPAYFMTFAQLNFLMAEAAEKGLINGGSAAAGQYYTAGLLSSFEANGVDVGSYNTSYTGGLQQIAEQEWISLFMQGYEAWAEQRRTGYPDLPLAIDAEVSSIPSRLNYPRNEQSLNNANYTSAVQSLGGDLLTTPIWWLQ